MDDIFYHPRINYSTSQTQTHYTQIKYLSTLKHCTITHPLIFYSAKASTIHTLNKTSEPLLDGNIKDNKSFGLKQQQERYSNIF